MSSKRGVPKMTKSGSKYQARTTSSVTTYVLAGLAVVVIAAVVIVGVIYNANRDKGAVDAAVLEGSSIVIGQKDAGHTIDLFEDFQCPACKMFEATYGQKIIDAVNSGKLRLRMHFLNFLDGPDQYSSRAAGAANCVAAQDQGVFLKFHTGMFEKQPTEGGAGLPNSQIATIARDAGANRSTQKCIDSGSKVSEAQKSAESSSSQLSKALGGNAQTPTVLSAGKKVEHSSPDWLDKLLASPADAPDSPAPSPVK